MRVLEQNKTKCLRAILVTIATLCLVVLGMRIAYIKGDFKKPKQRPRATIEESQKQFSLSVVIKQDVNCPALTFVTPSEWSPVFAGDTVIATCCPEENPVTLHDMRRIPPRASPVIPS